jgi:hypothetical protein
MRSSQLCKVFPDGNIKNMLVWILILSVPASVIALIIWDALNSEARNRQWKVTRAVDDPPHKAKQRLVSDRIALLDEISANKKSLEDTKLKRLADLHSAIDAIEHIVAGWWKDAKWSVVIPAISILIASIAACINVITLNETLELKRVDTAVSWCKEYFLPSFSAYQVQIRKLRSKSSPYRLPNGAAIRDVNPADENIKLGLSNVELDDHSNALSKEGNEIRSSLVNVLNFIDSGALMVRNKDMERDRFEGCFKEAVENYNERFDHSYIGLAEALASERNKDGSLQVAADQFPYSTCILAGVCDEAKMMRH